MRKFEQSKGKTCEAVRAGKTIKYMNKKFSIWSLTILLALCMGFFSCSTEDDNSGSAKKSYSVSYEVSVASPSWIGGVAYQTANGNGTTNVTETESGGGQKFSKSVTIVTGGISGSTQGFASISGSIVTWATGVGEIKDPKLSVKIFVNNQLRAQTSTYRSSQDKTTGDFSLSYTMTDDDKPK